MMAMNLQLWLVWSENAAVFLDGILLSSHDVSRQQYVIAAPSFSDPLVLAKALKPQESRRNIAYA
jgi:hypothetical protein